jgi:hypothetical protein
MGHRHRIGWGRGALVAAALSLALACTPARASAFPATEDAALLSTLPDRLASLRRQGPVREGALPRAAPLLAFAKPGVLAAIMLSGQGTLPVPDGPTSTAARGALAEATSDASLRMLEEASRQARAGHGRRPTELRWRSFVIHDGSATDLLCNRATLPAARGQVTEIVCVTGVAGRMMTVGLTLRHPRDGQQEAIRLACRFAAAARAALREAGRLHRA